ncbi:hypothetical protein GE09DRAFT_1225857 [Coniochaeta sp. 2T2.1]|nr:hypothetical protein GE09DRAFT_1225857 [Coniochaeta sp. 2T2.1]
MVSTKRPADPSPGDSQPTEPANKKPRVGGFRVPAPANLPDGPWRRKAVKIKQELIVKSKIKKEYAKVKAKVAEAQPSSSSARPKKKDIFAAPAEDDEEGLDKARYNAGQSALAREEDVVEGEDGETGENKKEENEVPAPPALHPDRIAMLDGPDPASLAEDVNGFHSRPEAAMDRQNRDRRRQQRKPGYFEKELAEAERKKAEAEARAAERERREKEREKAIKERERHRRIMAKARSGGRDGKRKLGKESIVMLDRVKRLVGQK